MTSPEVPPTAQEPGQPLGRTASPAIAAHTAAGVPGFEMSTANKPATDSNKFIVPLLVVLSSLLALLLAFQLTHRPKYEYMTAAPSDYTWTEEMNALGAEVWKADSCRRASDGADYSPTFNYECIMSRPKLGW